MTNTDLEEIEERIESRFKTLDTLIKLGWTLVGGAFAIGVWVTTIQLAINQHSAQLDANQRERIADVQSIRALEIKDSSDTQLLKSIVEKLDRIENKLNP